MTLAVCWFVVSSLASPAANDPPANPVAIVTTVHGMAWAKTSASRQPLNAFDWLPADAVVEVASSSALTVVFLNGARYEFGADSRARITSAGLAARSGNIKRLAPVSKLPAIAPIADGAPTASGAVRIRGRQWPMFPSGSAAALASATVLRFAPVPRAERYDVEVRDEANALVFTTVTNATSVEIPTGALQPARRYRWRLRAPGLSEDEAHLQASFATLSDAQASSRNALAQRVRELDAPELWALLGMIDSRLGLLADARAEFDRAAAEGADVAAIASLRDEVNRQLESIPDR
jgi:hypothetical protein